MLDAVRVAEKNNPAKIEPWLSPRRRNLAPDQAKTTAGPGNRGPDSPKKLDFRLEDQAYFRTYELSNSAQGYVDGCGFADFVRAQRARRFGEFFHSCSNTRL